MQEVGHFGVEFTSIFCDSFKAVNNCVTTSFLLLFAKICGVNPRDPFSELRNQCKKSAKPEVYLKRVVN